MSKKQNELKNAIQSLKVSEALRLSKGQAKKDFAFKPPEQSEIKPISVQADPSLPEPEMKTNSASGELSSKRSQLQNGLDRNDLSVKDAPIEPISAPADLRVKSSPVPPTSDVAEPRSSRSQFDPSSDSKDSTGFDLSPFLSGIGEIQLMERGDGTFHIPHKIYEFVHKAVDTKVELLVFNCLLRYTLGFQRATCQASQSFISRWTGIAVPNVRKALKSLIDRRFIRRLEEGTISHDSAIYELPIVTAYLAYDQSRKLGAAFKKPSEIKKRSDQRDLGSSPPQIRDQNDRRSEIDSISKKEIENKNRNKTLSPELPSSLQNYFSDELPIQKREREWKAFESLKGQFTVEQIERAVVFVRKHGALEDKLPVHSPMAYLALCIGEVLKRAQDEDEILKRRQAMDQRQALESQVRQNEEARNADEFRRKEQAFCRVFPDAQRQEAFVQEICGREQFGWKPQGQIARSIAIQTWWDELSQSDRQAMEVV